MKNAKFSHAKKWIDKKKSHRKVCTTLNYNAHFLILTFAIAGYISISAFVSLVVISMGITSSAAGLKNYVKTKKKRNKSIIKENRRNKIKYYY